jgi:Cytochrome b5-like Heme/Steroid binding domain
MPPKRSITKNELEEHVHENDYWVAVEGVVYDMTNFDHPGGRDSMSSPPHPQLSLTTHTGIFAQRGRDATPIFVRQHGDDRLVLGNGPPAVGLYTGPPRGIRSSRRISDARKRAAAAEPKPELPKAEKKTTRKNPAVKKAATTKKPAAAKPTGITKKPKAVPKVAKQKAAPVRSDRQTRSKSVEYNEAKKAKASPKPKAVPKPKAPKSKAGPKSKPAPKLKAVPARTDRQTRSMSVEYNEAKKAKAAKRGRPAGVVKKATPKKRTPKK